MVPERCLQRGEVRRGAQHALELEQVPAPPVLAQQDIAESSHHFLLPPWLDDEIQVLWRDVDALADEEKPSQRISDRLPARPNHQRCQAAQLTAFAGGEHQQPVALAVDLPPGRDPFPSEKDAIAATALQKCVPLRRQRSKCGEVLDGRDGHHG